MSADVIKRDAEGRYCLNDVHKAAGEEQRHRPKYWLENSQTLELIGELEKGGIPPISKTVGRKGGTYVAKELVYAYSMWVSPAMNLRVIRTFDDYVQGRLTAATEGVSQFIAYQFALADKAAQDATGRP